MTFEISDDILLFASGEWQWTFLNDLVESALPVYQREDVGRLDFFQLLFEGDNMFVLRA